MARGAIYDNCLHRLMQSPHHLEAQALAKTHSLYLSNLTYMRPPPLTVALPYGQIWTFIPHSESFSNEGDPFRFALYTVSTFFLDLPCTSDTLSPFLIEYSYLLGQEHKDVGNLHRYFVVLLLLLME
jgi:hypothetical protein